MAGKRKADSAAFTAKVALGAIRGEATVAGRMARHGVHRTAIHSRTRRALAGRAAIVPGRAEAKAAGMQGGIETLHRRTGRLVVERDFPATASGRCVGGRRDMIDPRHPSLPAERQCAPIGIRRSSRHGPARRATPPNPAPMRPIDAPFMQTPVAGSRQMARHLRNQGRCVSRKRARRLTAGMGLRAASRMPCTMLPTPPEPPKHRHLPGSPAIDWPGQVWCADITRIPMQRGFLDLVAIMDRATRRVPAGRPSNTMDGRGCRMDGAMIERPGRSPTHEGVHPQAVATGSAAGAGIGRWIGSRNTRRPHPAPGGRTPVGAHRGQDPKAAA